MTDYQKHSLTVSDIEAHAAWMADEQKRSLLERLNARAAAEGQDIPERVIQWVLEAYALDALQEKDRDD